MPSEIITPRLKLRPWRDEDLPAFAALNADPRVMAHFPNTLWPAESEALVQSFRAHFAEHGFGRWAVEVPSEAPFIGFVGLAWTPFEAAFTPCVELAWRLDAEHWGKGYATEAARAVADHAFGPLGLPELLAFTVPANRRSRGVMERLGMRHCPAEDFLHPVLPEGHPLRPHVLYRLTSADWRARRRRLKA